MENQDYNSQKLVAKGFSLLITLSTVFILTSLVAVVFQFSELRTLCVCISNWMAWGWIGFGTSILFGLAGIISSVGNELKIISKVLLVLQAIAFFAGIFLAVMFGSNLLDVL